MQEYLPALVPLTLGLGAFAIGLLFALRERNASKLRNRKREGMHQELDLGGGSDASARSRQIG
jgi:hypothetical protein